jgi:hypothetical protein
MLAVVAVELFTVELSEQAAQAAAETLELRTVARVLVDQQT